MPPEPRKHRPVPFTKADTSKLHADVVVEKAELLRAKLLAARDTLETMRRARLTPDNRTRRPDATSADLRRGPIPVEPDRPPNRADSLLPFLLIRSYQGDIGARPNEDATTAFSSPDIIMATPRAAGLPPEPTVRGRDGWPDSEFTSRIVQYPGAGVLCDVWVHVWNLGRAPAYGVRVRAWAQGADGPPGRYIGGQRIDLGDRGSDASHRLVKVGAFEVGGNDFGIWAAAESIADISKGTSHDALTRPDQWGTGVEMNPYDDRHVAFVEIM
jgi:hypothetical protein